MPKQAATHPPIVIAWVTDGGVLETLVQGDVELVVVDFQNLVAGNVAPELSPAVRTFLKRESPVLLSDIETYQAQYACENCRTTFNDASRLREIKNLLQRVAPGEIMPAGECPKCGALVHLVQRDADGQRLDLDPGACPQGAASPSPSPKDSEEGAHAGETS